MESLEQRMSAGPGIISVILNLIIYIAQLSITVFQVPQEILQFVITLFVLRKVMIEEDDDRFQLPPQDGNQFMRVAVNEQPHHDSNDNLLYAQDYPLEAPDLSEEPVSQRPATLNSQNDDQTNQSTFPQFQNSAININQPSSIIQSQRRTTRYAQTRARELEQRRRELDRIHTTGSMTREGMAHFADGVGNKTQIIWLFFLAPQNRRGSDYERIMQIYNHLSNTRNEIFPPIFADAEEVSWFLQKFDQNVKFKIVCDMKNIEEGKTFQENPFIEEIIIYVGQKEDFEAAIAYQHNPEYFKIRQVVERLEKVIDRLEREIQFQIRIRVYNSGSSTSRLQNQNFPNYMRLKGADKSEALIYRLNLYGAKNIPAEDREERWKSFIKYAENTIDKSNQSEVTKLKQYKDEGMDKQVDMSRPRAKKILQLYVSGIFYYRILNSTLRLMKPVQQFKQYSYPFFETYEAIRLFHRNSLENKKKDTWNISNKLNVKQYQEMFRSFNPEKQSIVFRGVRHFLQRDLKYLINGKNSFIEMFGFLSCSKDLDKALQFTNSDRVVVVIHVPNRKIEQWEKQYDHGFTDFQAEGIQVQGYSEKQVLFNALNIYEILEVQKMFYQTVETTFVHLKYGAILELMEHSNLQAWQHDVLFNYRYCTYLSDKIEDEGDIYEILNEFELAQSFYQNKLDAIGSWKNHFKLSKIQHKKGKLTEAEKNNRDSLRLLKQQNQRKETAIGLQVYSVHSSYADIQFDNYDFIKMEQSLQNASLCIPADEISRDANQIQLKQRRANKEANQIQLKQRRANKEAQRRAKKEAIQIQLMQKRAKMYFKRGQLKNAESTYQKCKQMLLDIECRIQSKVDELKSAMRWEKTGLFFRSCCCWCSEENLEKFQQIDANFQKEERDLRNQHDREMWRKEIKQTNISIHNSLEEVRYLVGGKRGYEKYVHKGLQQLIKWYYQDSCEPQRRAKLIMIKEMAEENRNLVRSERELNKAIQLLQDEDPYSTEAAAARRRLADTLKKGLEDEDQKFQDSGDRRGLKNYSIKQRQRVVKECKRNFDRARHILLKNNLKPDSQEIRNIDFNITELHFKNGKYDQCLGGIATLLRYEHTDMQIVQCHILGSKIYLSLGEFSYAQASVEKARITLRNLLLKNEQSAAYIKTYTSSAQYKQICLQRTKIELTKSYESELCQRQLQLAEESFLIQKQSQKDYLMYASWYELKAMNQFMFKRFGSFEYYYSKCLTVVEKCVGRISFISGLTRCRYSVYLIKMGDLQKASKLIKEADEVFKKLYINNPATWALSFCKGLLVMKSFPQKALSHFKDAKFMAQKVLGPEHISNKIIDFQMKIIKLNESNDDQLRRSINEQMSMSSLRCSRQQLAVKIQNSQISQGKYLEALICAYGQKILKVRQTQNNQHPQEPIQIQM